MGQFQGLTRLQRFKPVEDHGMAFRSAERTQIEGADKRGWHGEVFRRKREVHPNNLKMHQ